MALALTLLPLVMALAAFAVPSDRWRPWLLPLTAVGHLTVILASLKSTSSSQWVAIDPLGGLVLLLVSTLFLCCSLYAVAYLHQRPGRPNRIFCISMLSLLGMMSLVCSAQHLGLMWVAMEATTLAGAPLIHFNRTTRSIEATWKYLLVCSVGIALALLGSFFLAYASLAQGLEPSLLLVDLVRQAPLLSTPWLHAAFALLFIGYGTKMGLAPMHTWKPDAYGESPGVVGAIFAGGLTSCAFLGVLRVWRICLAAGESRVLSGPLIVFGVLSMAIAASLMIRQRDLKRLFAYSSVEHMGILAIGTGLGGLALWGALLHMINNAITKGALFLAVGNIHRLYRTKSCDEISGALRALPLSSWCLLTGLFAATGSPPFGPFVSLFVIVSASLAAGHWGLTIGIVVLLLIAFVGMAKAVLRALQGSPVRQIADEATRPGALMSTPMVALILAALLMGVFIPTPLRSLIDNAAAFMDVRP